MGKRLFSPADIGSGEKYMLSILLVQALFLGIFIGIFDISAHSMFLAVFNEKDLARAYVLSGLAGLGLFSAGFSVQAGTGEKIFRYLDFSGIAVITLILWILLLVNPAGWVLYLVFIMLGPLNIVSVLGLRNRAGAILLSAKAARFFSSVDTALISGIIISSFGVPLLLLLHLSIHNILLISVLSAGASAMLQFSAGDPAGDLNGSLRSSPRGFKSTLSVLNIFKTDSYSRFLGIFVILSVISALFIQYSFLAVTRQKFPAAGDMAMFLGIFTGAVMLMTLFGKLILFSYLLRNYGLKICLVISPVLLVIFTILAVIAGFAMGFTTETAGGFLIFFIMLALLRFLSRSLDDSIENPTYRLLYQTIDENIRFGVQSVMDSAVKEAAALLAGLFLAGLGILAFIRFIHFPLVLVAILIIWIWVAYRLYREYIGSVRRGLDALRSAETLPAAEKKAVVYKNRFFGERSFRLDYFSLISGDYSVFDCMPNIFYFRKILDHAGNRGDISLVPVIKKLTDKKFDETIRAQAAELARTLEELATSLKREDERLLTAKRVLSETRMPQTTEILRLLRDKSIETKRIAIYMIGKFRLTDLLPEVCECLNIQGLEPDAAAVLKAFGSRAEEELIRFYLVSSGNISASKTILRLLSGMQLNEGAGFLFSRLWSNSRQLKEVAAKCLASYRFEPSAEEKERLNMLISDIVGIITWNLSARRCLERNNDDVLLREINKELGRWTAFLNELLSVTYNAAAVTRIRKSLEFETVESVHYAHAIIDIIVDESVKAKIIYLLDAAPDDEKLRNLSRFFPVDLPSHEKLLEDILNRDYNLLGIWTKASVLRSLKTLSDPELSESVVALLFSPESILQEEAVRLIARSDLMLYKSVYHRIPLAIRKHLDMIIEGEAAMAELLYEKIVFLSGIFEGLPEEDLLFLARKLGYFTSVKTLIESVPEAFLLWAPVSGVMKPAAHAMYNASELDLLEKTGGQGLISVYTLPLKTLEDFLYQYPDYHDTVMDYFEKI